MVKKVKIGQSAAKGLKDQGSETKQETLIKFFIYLVVSFLFCKLYYEI
jgi:hypothetical protein